MEPTACAWGMGSVIPVFYIRTHGAKPMQVVSIRNPAIP